MFFHFYVVSSCLKSTCPLPGIIFKKRKNELFQFPRVILLNVFININILKVNALVVNVCYIQYWNKNIWFCFFFFIVKSSLYFSSCIFFSPFAIFCINSFYLFHMWKSIENSLFCVFFSIVCVCDRAFSFAKFRSVVFLGCFKWCQIKCISNSQNMKKVIFFFIKNRLTS